jgi:hypothetical protein
VADPSAPILTVRKVVAEWSHSWEDVSFAATADLGRNKEVWVFALTAGPLAVGDEIDSAGGRAAGIGVSAFTGGVIPVEPYQARIYEYLGRRGGGLAPDRQPAPQLPTVGVPAPADVAGGGGPPLRFDTETAAPSQLG